MNVDIYAQKVIELFKSGTATDKQWEEMAYSVLAMSEGDPESTEDIDKIVNPCEE
jgi:hypothetical protein